MHTSRITGADWKLMRQAHGLRQVDVARHYGRRGVDRVRISIIESQAAPSDRSSRRYAAALAAAAAEAKR